MWPVVHLIWINKYALIQGWQGTCTVATGIGAWTWSHLAMIILLYLLCVGEALPQFGQALFKAYNGRVSTRRAGCRLEGRPHRGLAIFATEIKMRRSYLGDGRVEPLADGRHVCDSRLQILIHDAAPLCIIFSLLLLPDHSTPPEHVLLYQAQSVLVRLDRC